MRARTATRTRHLSTATPIDAGEFGAWLAAMRAALRGQGGTDVPCGDCVGCCVSSYHVALRASDAAARARVPGEWLVPPPVRGEVQAYIGFGDDGRCPMLTPGGCSIYAERPQTCRDYDCRVFAAAGLPAGDERRTVINRRVAAWAFSYRDDAARAAHAAVRAAASFIGAHAALWPAGQAPGSSAGTAVLAVKAYRLFLGQPTAEAAALVRAIRQEARDFDAGGANGAPAGGAQRPR